MRRSQKSSSVVMFLLLTLLLLLPLPSLLLLVFLSQLLLGSLSLFSCWLVGLGSLSLVGNFMTIMSQIEEQSC